MEYVLILFIMGSSDHGAGVTSQIIAGFKTEELCRTAMVSVANDYSDLGAVSFIPDVEPRFKINARCILRSKGE